jgi:hypothetical protein
MDQAADARTMPTIDRGWATSARAWGLFSGVAIAVATLLFLVEATGLLGSPADYAQTAAGQLKDEAVYWAAFFAYRHDTLWDYALRDGLFFFGFLGLLPLLLAANVATGGRRAMVQIGGAFLAVGALFGAMNALVFFVDMDYWRGTGWETTAPEIMAAVGRDTQIIDGLSGWFGTAAYAALAIGFVSFGRACRSEAALPRRLSLVAFTGAVVLAAMFLLNVAEIDGTAIVYQVLALVVGVVIAPIFAIGLGLHLGRTMRDTDPTRVASA